MHLGNRELKYFSLFSGAVFSQEENSPGNLEDMIFASISPKR